ncbi:MAG: hypothetical protein LBC48_05905 [Dysgonamonadaceae bacterium]|jgi:hypothetical protein|nr:hypothetical protein [Dysgonamonadaceae bacterium]
MDALSESKNKIRQSLFRKLKRVNAFWSYDPESVTLRNCDDRTLIYKILVHLDVNEINQLFRIYDQSEIQDVWEKELCIQGDYYRRLNKFLAYCYFDIAEPEKYIKNIERKHYNTIKKRTNQKLKMLQ